VYGELLDATAMLRERIGEPDATMQEFLIACADTAAASWDEADQGIWEVRGEPQHFLHSKLMCWVALDRAIDLAEWLNAAEHVDRWSQVRDEIATAIIERGWHPEVEAFTQAFGSEVIDAAALMIPIFGFLPADDERMRATIERVEQRLTDEHGLVHRYEHTTEDGLSGQEGTFLLCSFWLAQCHALAGDVARAREVFELAAGFRNDLGLLSEEVDTSTGELLGNFPQAFSHIGLINAAWAIHRAERAADA
jgi:alpha,alpha-trehalase